MTPAASVLQVDNILNGSVRVAESYREADGWRLPLTTEDDVAFALKCVRVRRAADFRATLRQLAAIGAERSWIGEEDLREIARRTGSPIRYLRFTIGLVNRWLAGIESYAAALRVTPDAGWFTWQGMSYEGGLTTTLILAGDDTSLAPWVLAHTALANANVIVKSSSVEPLTSFLFARAMLAKGLRVPALLSFDTSSPEAVAQILKLVAGSDQSIVFGEDRTIQTVYDGAGVKPPHKAIPFYSGRSGAIVCSDADLPAAARDVVFGATMDRGNKCVTTKKVWVPRRLAGRFEALLAAEGEKLRMGDPLDERVTLGQLAPYARELADSAIGSARVVYDRGLVVVECSPMSRLVREELPYPIVALCPYGDGEDPVDAANASVQHGPTGKALVMSVFTGDPVNFRRIAGRLSATKVLRNAPTVLYDYQTSHQGMHLFLELVRPRELVEPSAAVVDALTRELGSDT